MPDYDNDQQPVAAADMEPTATQNRSTAPADAPGLPPASQDVNLEDAFSKLFKSSVSGTGEEELLRIASDYALQINAKQIKCLLYLVHWSQKLQILAENQTNEQVKNYYFWQGRILNEFVFKWLDWKKHNNSDIFVMRALDSISLRKFINENTLKVNIEK